MAKNRAAPVRYVQPYRYPSPNIPLSAIRRFARQIAERFKPEKIILFGSYAYGKPHEESDVDLMVIMPARNVIDQAIRIDLAIERQFSVDIHVRTPYQIKQGLKEGDYDWFLFEVMTKGEVLYDSSHRAVGGKAKEDLEVARLLAGRKVPRRNAACFHCQQASEKYLKSLLQELGIAVPRTHDMEDLIDKLLPHDARLGALRRGVASLTKHAVESRYPGPRATTRQMHSALKIAERVRTELRARLGLPP
jgi:HEPN domain-containing protein